MATQAQIDQFLSIFSSRWNSSIKDRQAYNNAIAIAEIRTGLVVGSINGVPTIPGLPTFAQLVDTPSTSSPTSAGKTVQDDAVVNPNQTPPVVANPVTGRISAAPPTTSPTNAQTVPTVNAGDGDQGTNAPTKSFLQTQSTTDANGNSIGIALPDESGAVGTIRRNPDTGELYDTGGLYAPTSTGVGQYDDATGVDAAVARNAQDDADNAYGGNTLAEYEALTAAQNAPGNISTTGETLRITPQPNVLDRFSSYTYRASWYLMTPEQYEQLVVSHKKKVNGYMLLMQSGGAPVNSGGAKGSSNPNQQTFFENNGASSSNTTIPGANDADAGRNPFFPNDFYFDSLSIENLIIGNGTRAPHSIANIKFTVVEPANITLLDRLYEAVQDFMPAGAQRQNINYTAVVYLMVIRFYGYDEKGNLVTNIGAPDRTGKSDPNAVIEKYIPFKISKCDWSVEGKLVSYQIEGMPPGVQVAAGTKRGTIPYDIQLTAKSIGDLLGGDAQFATATAPAASPGASTTAPRAEQASVRAIDNAIAATNTVYYENDGTSSTSAIPPAPPNANAASTPAKTLTQGLMGALNDFQQQLKNNGTYQYADTYKIVFASGGPGGGGQAIEKAKLIPPGTIVNKKNTPTAGPVTSDIYSAEMAKVFSDISSRNYSITAGMQIVQAIDMAIRNSDFIYAQQTKIFTEEDDEETRNGTGKDVTWYNITFQALPKKDQYDNKRNDYAYDITFIVNTYTPMNFSSNFFPINNFRGLHKQYNYWFTGQNTAVLEYKETLNNLYNLTISGNATTENFVKRQAFTSSMRDQPYYAFQSASTESRQGVTNKENEPGSNLAENLYDPTGLAECKLKIVGDPAWIQQGSFASGVDPKNFEFSAFSPDGTINFDARQIMFEIAWQRPQDYNLKNGLADPYSGSSTRQPVQSRVYTAKKVTSNFEKGSFTQVVEGLLYFFMKPDATNKAVTAPKSNIDASGRLNAAADPRVAALQASLPGATPNVDLRGRLTAESDPRVAAMQASMSKALPAPTFTQGAGSGSTGVFNAAPPGPNDTPQPTPPPQPATSSSGETLAIVSPGAPPTLSQQLANLKAAQIQANGGVDPNPVSITPEQQAVFDRINSISGATPAPSTPQDIVREA